MRQAIWNINLTGKEAIMIVQTLDHGKVADTVTTHTTLKSEYTDPETGEKVTVDWRLKQFEQGKETGMIYNNNCVDLVIYPEAETIAEMIAFTYEEYEPYIPKGVKARKFDTKKNQDKKKS